jgi:hypothetical protein
MSSSLNSRRMTMEDDNSNLLPPKRTPWNKGKLIGAKPPLLARHVWLRGCDVVAMKAEDVAPNGYSCS